MCSTVQTVSKKQLMRLQTHDSTRQYYAQAISIEVAFLLVRKLFAEIDTIYIALHVVLVYCCASEVTHYDTARF